MPFSTDGWLVVEVVSASISVGLPLSKMSFILGTSSTVLLAGTVSLLQTASASTEALEHWLWASVTDVLGGEDAVLVVDACVPVLASTVAGTDTAGVVARSLELADTGLLFFDFAAWLTAASTLPPHEKIDSVA